MDVWACTFGAGAQARREGSHLPLNITSAATSGVKMIVSNFTHLNLGCLTITVVENLGLITGITANYSDQYYHFAICCNTGRNIRRRCRRSFIMRFVAVGGRLVVAVVAIVVAIRAE